MATGAPRLSEPVFEHLRTSQLFSGVSEPRLTWQFQYDEKTSPSWQQSAYEIEIVSFGASSADGQRPEVFHVESNASVLVPWPKPALKSRESASVRVRACGSSKGSGIEPAWTDWSESATIETVLLEKQDWLAQWVAASPKPEPTPIGSLQPIRFYKSFRLQSGRISKARIYITSLGVFDVYVNGQKASDDFMAPGWTCYQHRIAYRAIDITSLLRPGEQNVICVEVAEGWYSGRLGFRGGKRFLYGGDELAVLGQVEVHYESDQTPPLTLVTDDSWAWARSALRQSEIYDGETFDARVERTNWATLASGEELKTTKIISPPETELFFSNAPPVRVTESISASDIFLSKSGKTIIDFGQNLVGKLLVKLIDVPEGGHVTFKHAEVMEHGELGTRPLRFAKATDTVISSGAQIKNWTPRFTFHGFRYVQVEGWPSNELPSKDNFVAQVLHTDLQRRGYFECSNKSVNQLHRNVVWSMKGNFVSIPTDCPQRDERLGWTGDLQVFCPSATFLYDTVGMLGDWLQEVASEQLEERNAGIPPLVCPDIRPGNWPHMPQAVWDDITVLTPDVLHKFSSDEKLLHQQLRSMRAWPDQGVDRGLDGLWNEDRWQLGDWLDPTAPPDSPADGRTNGVMVADAYLVHTTRVLSQICRTIGRVDLAEKYEKDAHDLKTKFQDKYISPKGNLMSSSQTGISLAIHFDLYKNKQQLAVATAELRRLVRSAEFRISTGFAGTPIITHALTKVGLTQLAYRMLLETNCPSWLYPVTMGATTTWERWDSMLPNGDINPGGMTSFNHYALGAVADWLHGTVGGITHLEPGWKAFQVRPIPGGNLTHANVRFHGPYGLIKCSWQLNDGKFKLQLQVPPNSQAFVTLPGQDTDSTKVAGSGFHEFFSEFNAGEWPPLPLIATHRKIEEKNTIAE